ncbi:hypothetical protein [Sphingomonas colocasiae]|uniref:Uncharacterized protein n=1 Tax=Sphingomonas colocasiae TaxID=1848973 RepID=A0ABS7PI23_9SPHN|nr:hypothetical protein [Sphingomonas colocasiae]MBY8820941.1 hypothetical protein [Sphingomonas colocasiae]
MSHLILRYEPDPDDEVGRLWFDVRTALFSGSSFFWSNLGELPDLIEQIGRYPLDGKTNCRWEWGASGDASLVAALDVMQVKVSGRLEARVRLADLNDVSQCLAISFETEYVLLDAFRGELKAMYDGRSGKALLAGVG